MYKRQAVITPIVVIPVYQKAKRLLLAWDGEDESICDIAEKKLNVILMISLSLIHISSKTSGKDTGKRS